MYGWLFSPIKAEPSDLRMKTGLLVRCYKFGKILCFDESLTGSPNWFLYHLCRQDTLLQTIDAKHGNLFIFDLSDHCWGIINLDCPTCLQAFIYFLHGETNSSYLSQAESLLMLNTPIQSVGWILKSNAYTGFKWQACCKAVPGDCETKSREVGEETVATQWSGRKRQQRDSA